MYKLLSEGTFKKLNPNPDTDPELYKFVEETNTKGPKFSNYTREKLETFLSRIYELRKNNSNNTAG